MKSFKKKTFQHNWETQVPLISPKIIEPSALNLIELRRDKLILNEEAIETLKGIKDELIIVFIFGKEGTGKSFLMNLLVNANERNKKMMSNSLVSSKNLKGFKVNSNFNSLKGNKKGIYFWSLPLEKSNSKEKILFFDSEGVNSDNINQQTIESKLLALMIIISSLFIYNSKGDINPDSLNDLQLIVQLTDSINIESKNDKEEMISELCPKFIWTLRDFELDKYKKIKRKTDSYLEECLNDERFKGKNKDEINMISESLIKYFKKRECVILPSPVNDTKELVLLKRMNLNELEENFRSGFDILKKKIYESSEAKLINGKKLTGPVLVSLLKYFIREINKENVPNIDKIFTNLVKDELDISYSKAKNDFRKRMDKLKKLDDIDMKEIYNLKYEIITEYMKILEKIPEIYNKENYMKEYQETKERLEIELEKIIKSELDILTSDHSYNNKIIEEKKVIDYTNPKDILEDYLNNLIGFKSDMSDTIITKKDFEAFIKNDIKKTEEVINYLKQEKYQNNDNIENNDEIDINNKINEINEENDINKIKLDLEKAEKEEMELIGTYTQLLEKKDKYIKNSLRGPNFGRRQSLKSYSSKLVTINLSDDQSCELSEEEKITERCNCNMATLKSCILF